MQGKEFDWPQDEKLYALFFNGDTIDWEGELLSLVMKKKYDQNSLTILKMEWKKP